jgi:hypothetical protein
MNLLRKILFAVPYPGAIILHIILGAFLAFIVGVLFLGSDGHGQLWLPVSGAAIVLVIGRLIARK